MTLLELGISHERGVGAWEARPESENASAGNVVRKKTKQCRRYKLESVHDLVEEFDPWRAEVDSAAQIRTNPRINAAAGKLKGTNSRDRSYSCR